MANQFTMTIEEASRRYRFSADAIRQNITEGRWNRLDIHRVGRGGEIRLDPYNFDVWFNWMKSFILAKEKERRSRKWYLLVAVVISGLCFFAFRPETVGSSLMTLGFGVVPTFLVWYLRRMSGVVSPQYRHAPTSGQTDLDSDLESQSVRQAYSPDNRDFMDDEWPLPSQKGLVDEDATNSILYDWMPNNIWYTSSDD